MNTLQYQRTQQLVETLANGQILVEGMVLICLAIGLLAVYLELAGRRREEEELNEGE